MRMRFPGIDSVKKEKKRKHINSKLNNFANRKDLLKVLKKNKIINLKCTCLQFDERCEKNDAKSQLNLANQGIL